MAQCAMLMVVATSPAKAQQFHRETFEGPKPRLSLGLTDDPQTKLLEHELVTTLVHGDKQAEYLLVRNQSGSFCFVEYPFGPAAVIDELTISAWVHVNRPGTQIMARVVLPAEIDPATQKPVEVLIRGDTYEVSSRWRKLTLARPTELLDKQRQLLQAEHKRPISIRGAFVDRVIFDIHSGLGEVAVTIDDIQIGPIVEPVESRVIDPPTSQPLNLKDDAGRRPHADTPKIRSQAQKNAANLSGETFRVGEQPFFLRGIVRSDPQAPLPILRDLGCNAIFVDWPIAPSMAKEAHDLKLRLVPMLPFANAPERSLRSIGTGPSVGGDDDSLFYFVGGGLDRARGAAVESIVDRIREHDRSGRPIAGDVVEDFRGYSRRLDMVGARRFPLLTTLPLSAYRQWLAQRKFFGRPGTHYWSWIQTHADEDYSLLVYGHGVRERYEAPIGPLPQQIKLLVYSTLAAGYRGIVYSSDRALSDYQHGRDRMLQLALLNLELMLLEPFLAGGEAPVTARTSHPDVSAVVLRHPRGVAVLAFWDRPGTQYVVGQAAVSDLQIVVENAPESAQAFQISTAEVRGLRRAKDLGGIRVFVPEFDTTAIVILTTDTGLYSHYQELVQQIARQATDWQRELAEIQLSRTHGVHAQLELLGHHERQARPALHEAQKYLDESRTEFERGNMRESHTAAARCLRTVRLVQADYWLAAARSFDTPAAKPFCASFYTLPEHYRLESAIKSASFGPNQLSTGDFERDGNLDAVGWEYQADTSDGLIASALLTGDSPVEGQRALDLTVRPAQAESTVLTAEHTRVAMISPPVAVRAGQVARVSGKIRLPKGVLASVDGAMVWDSIGGETLALRFREPRPWTDFVLYRLIRRDGQLNVHLVMTGIGTVQFDELEVRMADNVAVPQIGAAIAPPVASVR
jgi:hypothetical protein